MFRQSFLSFHLEAKETEKSLNKRHPDQEVWCCYWLLMCRQTILPEIWLPGPDDCQAFCIMSLVNWVGWKGKNISDLLENPGHPIPELTVLSTGPCNSISFQMVCIRLRTGILGQLTEQDPSLATFLLDIFWGCHKHPWDFFKWFLFQLKTLMIH